MTHDSTPEIRAVSEALGSDIRVRRFTAPSESGGRRASARFEVELERDEPVGGLLQRLRDVVPGAEAEEILHTEAEDATPGPAPGEAGPRSHGRQTGVLSLIGPPCEVVEEEYGPCPATLGEVLVRAAERADPSSGVTVVDSCGAVHRWSWAGLLDTALHHAEVLREAVPRNGRVLLANVEPSATLTAFWSCVMADLDPVLIPGETVQADAALVEERMKALHGESPFDAVVRQPDSGTFSARVWDAVSTSLLDRPALVLEPGTATSSPRDTEARREAWRGCAEHGRNTERSVAFMTSGSTGSPKVVAQRHGGILSVAAGASWMNRLRADEVSLNWMPLSHVGGILMTHVRDAYLGARHITVETNRILSDPEEWFRIVHRERVTATWSPNFALKTLARTAAALSARGGGGYDLSSLRFYLNGGEAVSVADVAEFEKRLLGWGLRSGVVAPAWGMTETCSGIVYNTALDAARTLPGVPSVGFPVPGAEARVVPLEEQRPDGPLMGYLEVRGPSVLERYEAGAPESRPDAEGWFRTGDLGWVAEDGLHISGRDDSRVVVNGVNWNTADIESEVENAGNVVPGTSAVVGRRSPGSGAEEVLVLCASSGTAEETGVEVRRHLFDTLRLSVDRVVVVPEPAIERTAIGKIKKNRLVETFVDGPGRRPAAGVEPVLSDQAESPIGEVRGTTLVWRPEQTVSQGRLVPTVTVGGPAGQYGLRTEAWPGERLGVLVSHEDLCHDGSTVPSSELSDLCGRLEALVEDRVKELPRNALITVAVHDDSSADDLPPPSTTPATAWLRSRLNGLGFGQVRMLWIARGAPEHAVREAAETADLRDRRVDSTGSRWVRDLARAEAARVDPPPVHFVLLGGTGRAGTVLARHLLAEGHRVTTVGRRERGGGGRGLSGLTALFHDITTDAGAHALGTALEPEAGSGAPLRLVHLAGSPESADLPPDGLVSDVLAPKADGAPRAVALAARLGAPLTLVSSVSAHLGGNGVPYYAAACAAAELAARAEAARLGADVGVVVCSRIEQAEHRPAEAEIAELSGLGVVPLSDLSAVLAATERPSSGLVLGVRARNRYVNAEGAYRVALSLPTGPERAAAPSGGDLVDRLTAAVSTVLPLLPIEPGEPWFDLGMTSVDLPLVAGAVSREAGVEVSVVDLMRYPNITTLAEAVEQRSNRPSDPMEGSNGES